MNTAVWIVMCAFALVGLTQIVSWFIALKKPKGYRRGYYLLPLYDNPRLLRRQINYTVSQIDWGSLSHGRQYILLVDMGLGEEARREVSSMLSAMPGATLHRVGELEEAIRRLDNLQRPQDLV